MSLRLASYWPSSFTAAVCSFFLLTSVPSNSCHFFLEEGRYRDCSCRELIKQECYNMSPSTTLYGCVHKLGPFWGGVLVRRACCWFFCLRVLGMRAYCLGSLLEPRFLETPVQACLYGRNPSCGSAFKQLASVLEHLMSSHAQIF